MMWVIALSAAWAVASTAVGLVLGKGIKLADEQEPVRKLYLVQ